MKISNFLTYMLSINKVKKFYSPSTSLSSQIGSPVHAMCEPRNISYEVFFIGYGIITIFSLVVVMTTMGKSGILNMASGRHLEIVFLLGIKLVIDTYAL